MKLLYRRCKPAESPLTRAHLFRFVYWTVLAALLALFHANHPLEPNEGVVLNGAWHLLNGKKLYVDWFEITTPGSFYIVYWAWKLFGPSYVVAKALGIAAVFIAAIGIFRTIKLLINSPAAYAPPLLLAFMSNQWAIINYNTFNVALLIWATYFAAKSCVTRSSVNVVASGLLTGAAILFLQHKSIFLLLAITLFFLILHSLEKKAGWLRTTTLYLGFSLTPLGILLAWPFSTLYENLVYFPLFRYTRISWLPPYALMAAVISASIIFFSLRKSGKKIVALLAAIQVALLLTTLQRPDPYYVSFAIFPLLTLLPLAYERLRRPGTFSHPIVSFLAGFTVTASMAVIVILIPALSLDYNFRARQSADTPSIRYVKQFCTSPYLYAGPYQPGAYYETGKLNPTPFPSLFTNYHSKAQFQLAKGALEKANPDCAILDYEIAVRVFNYRTDNPVDSYILSNYSHVLTDRNTMIFKKNQ